MQVPEPRGTATGLNHALNGAALPGAETELVHPYELNFKGCISCFACKLKNGESYGRCAVNNDLRSILKKAEVVNILNTSAARVLVLVRKCSAAARQLHKLEFSASMQNKPIWLTYARRCKSESTNLN